MSDRKRPRKSSGKKTGVILHGGKATGRPHSIARGKTLSAVLRSELYLTTGSAVTSTAVRLLYRTKH